MPIIKVPVVHNLCIISQTHKEDLENRFFKKAEEIRTTKHSSAIRNPFEITEQFIKKYNLSHGSDEQEKYVDLAQQLLSRSKRRAGLKCMGERENVELPLAWTELLLLGLCRGKIQNDSLDSLLMSLDHAPTQAGQIPSLFYLAESVLYWICSDTSQKASLYTCEVKMLKLGYLVFLRLFLFQISGTLNGYDRSKSHLHNFLKALGQCRSCYEPYPNILFSVDFMLHVGETICGLGPTENDTTLGRSGSLEYDMNQVLWHCLLSWYCVQNNVSQLSQVAHHLVLLREQLHNERNWVDCALGLMVLGEAAKSSMLCLEILMNLHLTPRPATETPQGERGKASTSTFVQEGKPVSSMGSWPWQLKHVYTTVLADICLHSSNAEVQKAALMGDTPHAPHGEGNTGGLGTLLGCSGEGDWQLRYSAVQALVCVWRGRGRAPLQDGLRNAAWITLQEHLAQETDPRVRDAPRVIEAEMNLPEDCFLTEGGRAQPPAVLVSEVSGHMISRRLACTLSHLYLPPTPLQLQPCPKPWRYPPPFTSIRPRQEPPLQPRSPKPTTPAGNTQESFTPRSKTSGRASRQSNKQMHVDFNTRTTDALMRVVEDQWQKELCVKMAEEEKLKQEEREKNLKEEEERFEEVMRRRKTKVKKETRAYELTGCGR